MPQQVGWELPGNLATEHIFDRHDSIEVLAVKGKCAENPVVGAAEMTASTSAIALMFFLRFV